MRHVWSFCFLVRAKSYYVQVCTYNIIQSSCCSCCCCPRYNSKQYTFIIPPSPWRLGYGVHANVSHTGINIDSSTGPVASNRDTYWNTGPCKYSKSSLGNGLFYTNFSIITASTEIVVFPDMEDLGFLRGYSYYEYYC